MLDHLFWCVHFSFWRNLSPKPPGRLALTSRCPELYHTPIPNQSLVKSLAKRTGLPNWLSEVHDHMHDSGLTYIQTDINKISGFPWKGESSGLGMDGWGSCRKMKMAIRTLNRQSTCLLHFHLHHAIMLSFAIAMISSQEGKILVGVGLYSFSL